jgi:glycerophosphoryl diester phosphodiesterase
VTLPSNPGPRLGPPITFAHRGARTLHPENTLAAFRHAIEHGARGLETDAWFSADHEIVLVHDARVWGRRWGVVPWRLRIEQTTSRVLAHNDIPRLADLYAEVGADYELSIDLKSADVGEAIIDLARAHGDLTRLWLCSPSTRRLRHLREQAADVRLVHSQFRSRLPEPLERHAANLADAKIDVMNMHHSEWTAGLVTLFHRFGVQAFAWDVQEVRHLRAMIRLGIDAVYSDHVHRMVATVAEFT